VLTLRALPHGYRLSRNGFESTYQSKVVELAFLLWCLLQKTPIFTITRMNLGNAVYPGMSFYEVRQSASKVRAGLKPMQLHWAPRLWRPHASGARRHSV